VRLAMPCRDRTLRASLLTAEVCVDHTRCCGTVVIAQKQREKSLAAAEHATEQLRLQSVRL
jgi:hypothetical protein